MQNFFFQLTGSISHLHLGLLEEGFSRPLSEPDVDELVKRAAERLAKETGATLENVSVPMHLDGRFCFVFISVTSALAMAIGLLKVSLWNSLLYNIRFITSLSEFFFRVHYTRLDLSLSEFKKKVRTFLKVLLKFVFLRNIQFFSYDARTCDI